MNFLSDLKYVKSYKNRINGFFFFLSALGLHCCMWAFSSWGEWGLLIAMASLVAEHRLEGTWASEVVLPGSRAQAP